MLLSYSSITAMDPSDGSNILLLHLPGMDMQLAQPMVDAGLLPNLEGVFDRGIAGTVETAPPLLRPVLATSLATGHSPRDHGILHSRCPDKASRLGVRPATSVDLKSQPLWETVAAAGKKAAAVGWPTSYPASIFEALVVSDVFAEAQGQSFEEWPLLEDAVSDRELAKELADFRVHPSEVTPDMVAPFLQEGQLIDQETDERLALLVTTIARTASLHGAATWMAEHRPCDLLAVHFDLFEKLSSAFLQYRAPKMGHITQRDFEVYQNVVEGAYRFFDLMLGRYLELVGDDCQVMIVSSHGYLQEDLRVTSGANARRYRSAGTLIMTGPSVKQDELLHGARIQDVVPTALAVLGVPVPTDLPGQVLESAFEVPLSVTSSKPVAWETSWRPGKEAECLAYRQLKEEIALRDQPALNQDPDQAYEDAEVAWQNNLAQACIAERDLASAKTALLRVLELSPDHREGLYRLAQCHFGLKEYEEAQARVDEARGAGYEGALFDYLAGQIAECQENHEAASDYFSKVEASELAGPSGLQILISIGNSHIRTKAFEKAEQSYLKALAIDDSALPALNGAAASLLARRRFEEASDYFRRSLAKRYEQAEVHCDLGQCLRKLKRLDEAAESYRQSLALKPSLFVPKQALAEIESEQKVASS